MMFQYPIWMNSCSQILLQNRFIDCTISFVERVKGQTINPISPHLSRTIDNSIEEKAAVIIDQWTPWGCTNISEIYYSRSQMDEISCPN